MYEVERFQNFKYKKLCSLSLTPDDIKYWKYLIDNKARIEIFIDGHSFSYRFGYYSKKHKSYFYRRHVKFTFWNNTNGHLTHVNAKSKKTDF